MKAVFILSVFVIVLSSVLGRPVDVEGPDCAPITSLLEGNLILRDVAQNSPSLFQVLFIQRMLSAAESVCEVLDYFKHTEDSNPIGLSNSSCLNSTDSVSSTIVHTIRTRTCAWLNSLSETILSDCKSHAYEVDLFCHEVRLRSFSQKIADVLPGRSTGTSVVLLNWVLEHISHDQTSDEALQLICRHVYPHERCLNLQ